MVYGAGMLFGSLVLVTESMPGWYFWVIPFVALFYAEYFTNHSILLWFFSAAYVAYFVAARDLGVGAGGIPIDVLFTGVQVLLLGILVEIWALVIHREMPLLGRIKPLLIGIAGDSGAGKNTLTQALGFLLGTRNVVVLEGDDYHRWERNQERWNFYTHLNPKANLLPVLSDHLDAIMSGRFIFHPHYDHGTGRFTTPRELKPNKTVVIQGLHTFYLRDMRERLDIRVFLAPDRRVQLYWKLQRDVAERGLEAEQVLASLAKRERDSESHINPQRDYADWIIEVFPTEPITEQEIIAGKKPALGMRHVFWNDAPVAPVAQALAEMAGCAVKIDYLPNDINRMALQILGGVSEAQTAAIAARLFPNIRQITRGRYPPEWKAGMNGVNQLLALALIAGTGE
jgi:uridine kinase